LSPASKRIFTRAATKKEVVQSLQIEQQESKKEEEAMAQEHGDLVSDYNSRKTTTS
jgi:hypothetical protein